MRKSTLFVALSVSILLSAVAWAADEKKEEKVALDKVPKPVLDAAKAKFPKAELVGAEKEEEDGKTVYEVALKDHGTTVEIIVTPEGKILVIEKVVAVKDVPKVVTEALESRHAKATIKKIEEIIKEDKLTSYEFLIVAADKKRWEVIFDPKGKFVKEEEKIPKKKEKK